MKAELYVNSGVAVIRGNNIGGSRGLVGDFVYVPDAIANQLPTAEIRPQDLLFPHRGAIGQVALAPETNGERMILSTSMMRLRCNTEMALPEFVFYWFRSDAGRHEILQFASTVGTPGIGQPLTSLRSMKLPLPPLAEQRAIAEALGALDGKIESNQRVRQTARALAQALVAKATAVDPWEVALSEVVMSMARGIAPRYADEDPKAPLVLNQKCVRDGWVDVRRARRTEARIVDHSKVAEYGDVLVNSTGTGTLGRVGRWYGPTVFVDGHLTVVKPDAKLYAPTSLALVMIACQSQIEALAQGSTGQTELSRERLGSLRIAVPSRSAANAIETELAELEAASVRSQAQDGILTELRDVLLPEVMSGRLRVVDVESFIEAAT